MMYLKNPDWDMDVEQQLPLPNPTRKGRASDRNEEMTDADFDAFKERRKRQLLAAIAAAWEYGEYLGLDLVEGRAVVTTFKHTAVDLPPGFEFSVTVKAGYDGDWKPQFEGWAQIVTEDKYERGTIAVRLLIQISDSGDAVASITVLPPAQPRLARPSENSPYTFTGYIGGGLMSQGAVYEGQGFAIISRRVTNDAGGEDYQLSITRDGARPSEEEWRAIAAEFGLSEAHEDSAADGVFRLVRQPVASTVCSSK